MNPFMLTLRRRELIAERTMAFHFAKPDTFQFKAGQTLDLTLLNPAETDAEGHIRTFSSRLPLDGPRYYTAGPPAMVIAMREMLAAAGVEDDEIRSEEFAGY